MQLYPCLHHAKPSADTCTRTILRRDGVEQAHSSSGTRRLGDSATDVLLLSLGHSHPNVEAILCRSSSMQQAISDNVKKQSKPTQTASVVTDLLAVG